MLTSLLVRLADAYSMIIFVYVMMSWLPNTQTGIIGDIYRARGKRRPVPEFVQEIDSAPWRYGGRNSHHRLACITIRGTLAGSALLKSDDRHTDNNGNEKG